MSIITDILCLLTSLLRALAEVAQGRARRLYETSILVDAPPTLVWSVLSANAIKFDGPVPVEIAVAPRLDDASILEGQMRVGDRELPIRYRELSKRAGQAASFEIMKEGSDPCFARGDDYFVSYAVSSEGRGSRVMLRHELTHTDFAGRICIPLAIRQSARRIKRHCERQAGVEPAASPVSASLLTGMLTFASFSYLFGWHYAAILIGVLLIHELGHAVAMRWVGQPVHGIYFIPFFGGVAVAGAPHRGEGERGFVVLMGPGLSVISTTILFLAWEVTAAPLFAELALVSAVLNLINLAPVLPLDGGQVAAAVLSRWDCEYLSLANVTSMLAGCAVAAYLEWYMLLTLLALTLLVAVSKKAPAKHLAPIEARAQAWLGVGYVATASFYGAVIAALV